MYCSTVCSAHKGLPQQHQCDVAANPDLEHTTNTVPKTQQSWTPLSTAKRSIEVRSQLDTRTQDGVNGEPAPTIPSGICAVRGMKTSTDVRNSRFDISA